MFDLKYITRVCVALSYVVPAFSCCSSKWDDSLPVHMLTRPMCNVTGAASEHSLYV